MDTTIEKNHIAVQVEVEDWRAAITAAGNILVEQGSVTPLYVKRMIEAVEEMGPYIVIAPHVALAHARPDAQVLKADISMVTLAKPVCFGHQANDPVQIVFAFAAQQAAGHLQQLVKLSRLLEDEAKIKELGQALTLEAAYAILNQAGKGEAE